MEDNLKTVNSIIYLVQDYIQNNNTVNLGYYTFTDSEWLLSKDIWTTLGSPWFSEYIQDKYGWYVMEVNYSDSKLGLDNFGKCYLVVFNRNIDSKIGKYIEDGYKGNFEVSI